MQNRFVTLFLTTLIFALGLAWSELRSTRSVAAVDTEFRARATVNHCPDQAFGGVSLELKYRTGSQTTYQDLSLTSQFINPYTQTSTFEFNLPATFGETPLYVAAFCRNAFGLSPASNEGIISNCDALATRDSDQDGLADRQEDTNCNGIYDVTDLSDSFNYDSDGDGQRDVFEVIAGFSPSNPGSSSRPMLILGGPFDPDGDDESNAVVWRPSTGTWYIKNFVEPDYNLTFEFGQTGDIPFGYNPKDLTSNVGVVRRGASDYTWHFRGAGLYRSNADPMNTLVFGKITDSIILGPWEEPATTNAAVARLASNGYWFFYIYQHDGTIREVMWGLRGDIPRVQDYDGDGIFDVAVFRASNTSTYFIRSTDGGIGVHQFGSKTAEFTVRGDYSGDGTADIAFWEPLSAKFTMLKSDLGFNDAGGMQKNALFYQELLLGTYFHDVPMSWNKRGNKILFTVVEHEYGFRRYRLNNSQAATVQVEQWGLPEDFFG